MRVLLSGGGTGGHINPAIAVAQYLREHDPGGAVLYAGTPDGMEARLARKSGLDFAPIRVRGFSRGLSPRDLARDLNAAWLAATARSRAGAILRGFCPDVVLGTGGYVSGPVVLAAARQGISCAIHEQNAFPGVTNRLLAKKADRVFLAVEEAAARLPRGVRTEVVGNPVRDSVIFASRESARKKLGLDDKLCVLSFGGSLGADAINRLAADLIAWHGREGLVHHIHGFGKNGREKFPALLKERGVDLAACPLVRASEYIDDMDVCLAAADLLICRAGAITISELEAAGKPAILVPSPNVTANHQYYNAMVLVKRDAALLLEEKDYTPARVVSMVRELWENPARLGELARNASRLAILDTARRICEGLEELAARR